MKKGLLLLLLVVLLSQAAFVIWMNSGSLESLHKDPWSVAGIADDVEVKKVKVVAAAPYPGPKATNPDMGRGLIRGRVVDPTGEPRSGVAVVADHYRDPELSLTRGVRRSGRWDTKTDDTGYFEFSTLPGGFFTVSAYTPARHALGEVTIEEEGATGELLLTLADTVSLDGQVFSPEGAALRDARVYPVWCDNQIGVPPYVRFPEKTDRKGRFHFSHLHGGSWRFLVAARKYAPFLSEPVAPARGEVVFNLRAGATLTGSVIEITKDRPEGRVEIVARESAFGLETCRARTDGRGHFELPGLRAATYRLTISSNRVAPVYSPIQISVNEEGVTKLPPVWVKPAGSLRGRVVLAGNDGEGIPGTTVRASQAGQATQETVVAKTDPGGYYTFKGLSREPYRITVAPLPGYAPAGPVSKVVDTTANQQVKGPVFVLERGLTVSGRVEDGEGRPVAQANVFFTVEDRPDTPMATRTNDLGLFSFEGIGGGESVTLRAERMDRRSHPAGPFAMNGEALGELVLKLDTPREWDTPSPP